MSNELSNLRVTTRDMDTGVESYEYVPRDGYVIVTAGRREVSTVQTHKGGTVQVTMKLVD